MRHLCSFILTVSVFACISCKTGDTTVQQVSVDTVQSYNEKYRPQVHFSPKEKWMNDPNGMVHYEGEYHLFYQYHPESLIWGPMHWGHAVSKDLVHWEHLPVALYPDSLGLIFSGSAVADLQNTSGFGTTENPPLVAVFTYHSMEKEKAGKTDYQNQGIAYSIDKGRTWTKYEHNPVLKNQGIKDFRDPKVFWHDESKKWVMILAVKDHTELWASQDLKTWSKLSEFGVDYGAHGGVWECPDLFELQVEGEKTKKWVMLVSINPGGPNGGSATQYFIGDFDGKKFSPDAPREQTSWLDYGPDNYAGITWGNVANGRKIFIGWMNNWAYGQELPTASWRGAATLPRDITLIRSGNGLLVRSQLSPEILQYAGNEKMLQTLQVDKRVELTQHGVTGVSKSIISGTIDMGDFAFEFANKLGQKILVGFDPKTNRFYIDRSKSGNVTFSKQFPLQLYADRKIMSHKINFTIAMDVSSVEVFFDDGVSAMTSLFFPDEELGTLAIAANERLTVNNLSIKFLESIWK